MRRLAPVVVCLAVCGCQRQPQAEPPVTNPPAASQPVPVADAPKPAKAIEEVAIPDPIPHHPLQSVPIGFVGFITGEVRVVRVSEGKFICRYLNKHYLVSNVDTSKMADNDVFDFPDIYHVRGTAKRGIRTMLEIRRVRKAN